MYKLLSNLKIDLDSQQTELFDKYINLFKNYNRFVNLISRKETDYVFEKHIYDSLAVNLFFNKYQTGNKIIDVGTGGGFPSLPMAICYKDKNITAIDSVGKKINFIKITKEKLKLDNINPLCIRVEDLEQKYRSYYDVGVSRAMAELRIILEYTIPYIKPGGYFVAYKSIKSDEEINSASDALKKLNSVVVDTLEYKLPLLYDNVRNLIIIRKEAETEITYPRKNGLIKKNPL